MKNIIKKILRKAGVDLVLYDARRNPDLCLIRLLKDQKISHVLDIGANIGQYARSLRESGYTGKISSFEPLSNAHSQLLAASEGDDQWSVIDRCAVGSEEGSVDINISGNSVSSSILAISDTHVEAAPDSKYVGTEKTPVKTLNQIVPNILEDGEMCHIKIDTQGYEKFVIEGADEIFDRVSSIELEVSLSTMYQGGWLAHEVFAKMANLGFRPFVLFPIFANKETGETYQMDGIFVRMDR